MAFDDIEISNYNGQPVLLYEFKRTSFTRNDGEGPPTILQDFFWRYCTNDDDLTVDSIDYTATAISDDGITQSGEATESQFVITMPVTEDFPTMFRRSGVTPSDIVYCTVRRVHTSDLDSPRVVWMGTVAGITQDDEIKCRITCNTLFPSFKRGGVRLSWTRGCPYSVYDHDCKVLPEDHVVEVVIESFTANTITSSDIGDITDDDFFPGGFISWITDEGYTERRTIKSQSGDTITLLGTVFGMAIDDHINAYPGCRRTRQICNDKFDNLTNMGGFPHSPGKSPFKGEPVF